MRRLNESARGTSPGAAGEDPTRRRTMTGREHSTNKPRRISWNEIGLLVGMGMILFAAIGEWLGWWRDGGVVLGIAGILISLWFGIGAAAERTVRGLETPLATIADQMATINIVLERDLGAILRLLDERLPPRT
jgi:hypothetical protein